MDRLRISKGFAEELRRSALEEFGSLKAYADALKVSAPEVSQLLGRAIKPETARRLAAVFASPAVRKRLREAYLDEYYPEVEIAEFVATGDPLGEIHRVVLHGNNALGLKIAEEAKKTAEDPLLWLNLAERVVQIELRRDRIATALRETTEIRNYAHENKVAEWVARSFWLEGNAFRNAHRPPFAAIQSARTASAEFSDSVGNELRCIMFRDAALDVLKSVGPQNARRSKMADALTRAWDSVRWSVEEAENENMIRMGLQVQARVEIAQEYYTKAEDTLEVVSAMLQDTAADMPVKVLLTRMRVAVKRGKFEEAVVLARLASNLSIALGDQHHAVSAENFAVDILVALRATPKGEKPVVFIPA